MSDKAGFVCHVNEVAPALQAARALNQRIAQQGVHIAEARRLSEGLLRVQMALLSEAVLTALDFYIGQGGGSRGARMLCDTRGPQQPQARQANLQAYRFLAEQEQRRREKIILRYDPALGMQISVREVREMEDTGKIYFEKNWAAYLTGEIYR
jgi:hypothetical protein